MYPGLAPHGARIDQLPSRLKAALAAACAQRQAEAYRAYVRRTGAGSADNFDGLLSAIWDDIRSPRASDFDHKNWEAFGNALMKQKTKSDAYGAAAEYAILSLLYSIDVLVAGLTQDTIYSSNHAFNSIDNFLTSPIGKKPQIEINKSDTSVRTLAHPLSQAEDRRQEQDLLDVEQAALHPEMIPAVVDGLRRRSAIKSTLTPFTDLRGATRAASW